MGSVRRGGARVVDSPGRRPRGRVIQMRVSDAESAFIRELGGGNLSEGFRRILDIVFLSEVDTSVRLRAMQTRAYWLYPELCREIGALVLDLRMKVGTFPQK